jgi:hypothetical protein
MGSTNTGISGQSKLDVIVGAVEKVIGKPGGLYPTTLIGMGSFVQFFPKAILIR